MADTTQPTGNQPAGNQPFNQQRLQELQAKRDQGPLSQPEQDELSRLEQQQQDAHRADNR